MRLVDGGCLRFSLGLVYPLAGAGIVGASLTGGARGTAGDVPGIVPAAGGAGVAAIRGLVHARTGYLRGRKGGAIEVDCCEEGAGKGCQMAAFEGRVLGQVAYPTCWAEESGRSKWRPRSIVAVAPIAVFAFNLMSSSDRFIREGHCYWRGKDVVGEEVHNDHMGSWKDAWLRID